MLYFWPYIAFFSAPILVRPLFQAILRILPNSFRSSHTVESSTPSLRLLDFLVPSLFAIGAIAAVHFNTIIHPYTLADNRHYVFYVFRILRQHPAIRYLAIPVYCVCAWLALRALGTTSNEAQAPNEKENNDHPISVDTRRQPCQTSFVVVWLITTTLSVVTAPLVEPRYFIVPWIIWRLNVQTSTASLSKNKNSIKKTKKQYDVWLGFETLWLLAIDAAVTYVFIFRGFTWPSEPGKVQRFIW